MKRPFVSSLLFLFLAGIACRAWGVEPKASSAIDPKAAEILKKSCAAAAGLKQLGLHDEEGHDEMSPAGQKIQLSNHRKILVSRPNRLFADSHGDTAHRSFYYDGNYIWMYDKTEKTYATEPAPDTLDAMFDRLHETHGHSMPLADLLFSDPHKVLTERIEGGDYLGVHRVGEHPCHHLAFRQRNVDWQLWVDAGDQPLPRKLIITYRRSPGEPQFAAVLRWDTDARPEDSAFKFEAPRDAKKIEIIKREKP